MIPDPSAVAVDGNAAHATAGNCYEDSLPAVAVAAPAADTNDKTPEDATN